MLKLGRREEKIFDNYIGKTIDNRYKILKHIGKGATGIVYLSYDYLNGKEVAIKILRSKRKNDLVCVKRFKNEAKAINYIEHQNIVKILDARISEEIAYVVSEYDGGINFASLQGYKHGFNLYDAIRYMKQILNAVSYLHSKNVIHKDIRPQNIVFVAPDLLKILDFGVADFPGNEPRLPFYRDFGSVYYLSPELIRGDDYDIRTDIYSLGVLFYRLLTGEVPFAARRSIIIGIMHNKKIPVSVKNLKADIPEEIDRITMKALEKNPDKRYKYTEEMLNDIEIYEKSLKV